MQDDFDAYLETYNIRHPQLGRNMKGRMPIAVFIDSLPKPNTDKEDTGKMPQNLTCQRTTTVR